MKLRQKMPDAVKQKVKIYIKNQVDISSLIEDYLINGENLAGAIIKDIKRVNENIQNTNFVRCIIGEEGKIANFMGSDLKGSNFQDVVFKGTVWFRNCNLSNCNFNRAIMTNVQYQNADLRNISLCETVIRMGSRCGYRAKFSWNQFKLLAKYLDMDMQDE